MSDDVLSYPTLSYEWIQQRQREDAQARARGETHIEREDLGETVPGIRTWMAKEYHASGRLMRAWSEHERIDAPCIDYSECDGGCTDTSGCTR